MIEDGVRIVPAGDWFNEEYLYCKICGIDKGWGTEWYCKACDEKLENGSELKK